VKKYLFIFISIFFGVLFFARGSLAATRLIYENFDDQIINSGFVVYGSGWAVLSPPQYNLNAVGKGGTGYCFSSGTVNEAYLCWENNLPNPWPSGELYVSFWMRYPRFESTDPHENIKVFYPHWCGATGYVHYSMSSANTIYYGANSCTDETLSTGNWLDCPNQTDGNWHHYEFYVKFSEGISRFWYDGVLKVNDTYGSVKWTNTNIYYISAPSIDAEEVGTFSRQVDDWEAWDGMPSVQSDTTPPAAPTGVAVI
jgi:hypothetical protein